MTDRVPSEVIPDPDHRSIWSETVQEYVPGALEEDGGTNRKCILCMVFSFLCTEYFIYDLYI